MNMHVKVPGKPREKWTKVNFNFKQCCDRCCSDLKLAEVTVDNMIIKVIYTCPECKAIYCRVYNYGGMFEVT